MDSRPSDSSSGEVQSTVQQMSTGEPLSQRGVYPKQCERAPDLAVRDGVKEVDESVLLERGYMTPLTRSLHLGSAIALIQGTAYNTGGIRYFTRELPRGLCYRQPPVFNRDDEAQEDEGTVEMASCIGEYVFAVAAFRCDLYYVPLGRGLLAMRVIGGISQGASTQAMMLKKNHHTPFATSPDALVLGFDLGGLIILGFFF